MENNNTLQDLQKYIKDIETIKDILLKVEERPIISSWAFYLSGILMFLCSALHYAADTVFSYSITSILLLVWLPAFIVISLLEGMGLYRKLSSESLPLFSKILIRHFFCDTGITIGSGFMIYFIIDNNLTSFLPSFLLIMWAIYYFLYSQITIGAFAVHGYFLVFSGIILHLTSTETVTKFIIVGILLGVSLIILGLTGRLNEKNNI